MNEEALYDKWVDWVKRVYDDVVYRLHHNRQIWDEINRIMKANPAIPEVGFFQAWLRNLYIEAQAMAIRRQIDTRNDSISLMRLLIKISRNPLVLSRERVERRWTEYGRTAYEGDQENLTRITGWAMQWFDQEFSLTDGSGVRHEVIDADRNRLMEIAEGVRQFASKHVAHLDEAGTSGALTWDDFNAAADELGKMLSRYLQLLTGTALLDPVPAVGLRQTFRPELSREIHSG